MSPIGMTLIVPSRRPFEVGDEAGLVERGGITVVRERDLPPATAPDEAIVATAHM